MFSIPDSIGSIYRALKGNGATIVLPGSTGTNHHFKATERSFISEDMGFKVSWPDGWIEDRVMENTVMRQLGWPSNINTAAIIISENAGILLPKISMVVENVGDIDIISYTQQRLNIWKTHQIETLDYDVCQDFRTVTEILFYKPVRDLERYHMQKTFLRNNKAYVINIFDLYPDNMAKKPGLTADIVKILHSFSFLESIILSQ
jgi:hypothetical protein